MSSPAKMWRWEQIAAAEEQARREAFMRPLPKNSPHLLEPVRCRVLKAFYLGGGRLAEVGAILELPRHDAESMQALGRVEVI